MQITNQDGMPFETFESARWIRDLLMRETGKHYTMIRAANGEGFLIETDTTQVVVNQQVPAHTSNQPIERCNYRRALRSWILSVPKLCVAMLILLYPVKLWETVFWLLQVRTIPRWVDTGTLITITTVVGLVMLGYCMIRMVLDYYATCLKITRNGVEVQSGIISLNTTSIRYSDIRSIGVKQTAFQRFLGVGTLEFSAAGSDGVDIRFDNVSKPATIKAMIQQSTR